MNANVFNLTHIMFNNTAQTQDEAFKVIAKLAFARGFVASETAYYQGLKARELEATTGFKDHIAIPHSKDASVLKPGLFLLKFLNEIPWQALDGKPIKVAFALTIPEAGATEHLKLLSLIARKLIDNEFRHNILHENEPTKIAALINLIDF